MTSKPDTLSESKGKAIPHNLDAEKTVLSCMTLSLDCAGTVLETLTFESFYKLEHQEICKALSELYDNNQLGDLLLLEDYLTKKGRLTKCGGINVVSEVINFTTTSANLDYYINIILEKSIYRNLIEVTSNTLNDCYTAQSDIQEIIDNAEKNIIAISSKNVKNDFVPIKQLVKSSIEKIEFILKSKGALTGIGSGFIELDKHTLGFQAADVVIIAARPSMGKTALALNIALNAALNGAGVAIFSLEMPKTSLVSRLLFSQARVSTQKLTQGVLSKEDGAKLQQAVGILADLPIFIDDTSGANVMELRGKARRLKAKEDIKLIIIDYLQLMSGGKARAENRQQEVSDMSRGIKALARELNVPILILSQLSRGVESRQDKKPVLSDLRESGAIEQDADLVLLLTRKEYYNPDDEPGKADLHLAKHRNGPTANIRLQWNSQYTTFSNLADVPEPDELVGV